MSPDLEYGVAHEHLGPDRKGDGAVRGAAGECPRPWPPADGDDADAGDLATVPARGHAVAEPAGDGRPGERLDLVPVHDGVGEDGPAAPGASDAGGPAERRLRADRGQLLGADQARRGADRPQSHGSVQDGYQVPYLDN